eukprot:7203859-Prymnesium_polylepis.1
MQRGKTARRMMGPADDAEGGGAADGGALDETPADAGDLAEEDEYDAGEEDDYDDIADEDEVGLEGGEGYGDYDMLEVRVPRAPRAPRARPPEASGSPRGE